MKMYLFTVSVPFIFLFAADLDDEFIEEWLTLPRLLHAAESLVFAVSMIEIREGRPVEMITSVKKTSKYTSFLC